MTDQELKQHVENALRWEPSVDTHDIGVSVEQGVVTLRGNVPSFSEKGIAERVALHTYGVQAVANDLNVRLTGAFRRSDTDIAQAAVDALKWHTLAPKVGIAVVVGNGHMTLKGIVDWEYQKRAVINAVRDLTGLTGITSEIAVKPRVSPTDVKEKIEAAFKRSAEVDARRVNVTTHDGTVVLTGNVHSWAERREAERAAWAAPGVTQIDDRLTIVP